MSKIVHKKVLPEYFSRIISGDKKFELRLADFDIADDDVLVLHEWNDNKQEYTGQKLEVVVTFVLKTKNLNFWSQEDIDQYGFQVIQFDSKENFL